MPDNDKHAVKSVGGESTLKVLLEPISADAPCGADARYSNAFDSVQLEIAKLDSPMAASGIKWELVVTKAREFLTSTSKDLRVASYLAYALLCLDPMRESEEGINVEDIAKDRLLAFASGLEVINDLITNFGDDLHPRRARLRQATLEWLVGRAGYYLKREGAAIGPEDRDRVSRIEAAAYGLYETIQTHLAESMPNLDPMLELVSAMRATLPTEPEPAPEPKKVEPAQKVRPAETPSQATHKPPPQADTASQSRPPTTPQQSSPVRIATSVEVPELDASDKALVDRNLQKLCKTLLTLGKTLRAALPHDPRGYRVFRTGLWVHLVAAPPQNNGRTVLPNLPEAKRQQLKAMLANQRWAPLLEECESSMEAFRWCLDLQYYAARALSGLGSTHDGARREVEAEVVRFVERVPEVLELPANDGTPLVEPDTRQWVAQLCAKGGAAASGTETSVSEKVQACLHAAEKLGLDGKLKEAVDLLEEALEDATGARATFFVRRATAREFARAQRHDVACAIYSSLAREIHARRLDEWDPELAASCLMEFIRSARANKHKPEGLSQAYERLCVLRPTAAMALTENEVQRV